MNKAVLRLKNVSKTYHNQVASNNINMIINKGDIYGLIGRNGAGSVTRFH